ncbi:MAG: rubredoxin [Clostridia bacterium]|nr:rubredoxin [Clostridia bacterium]
MKYVCDICGYEYDEEAEGTLWADLPEDYTCPVCGVGKENFSEAE